MNNVMNRLKNRRTLLMVGGVVVLLIAIPIAVFSLSNRQDIRQRAASNDTPQSSITAIQAASTPTPLPAPSPTATPEQEQYTAPNDTEQPTIASISQDNGAQVKADTQVELSATASDNIGVGNVEFLVNGTIICSSASPYTCNWTVPAQTNIQYVVTVRAYDLTGNVSTKSVVVTSF
jgi:hypothetical protein